MTAHIGSHSTADSTWETRITRVEVSRCLQVTTPGRSASFDYQHHAKQTIRWKKNKWSPQTCLFNLSSLQSAAFIIISQQFQFRSGSNSINGPRVSVGRVPEPCRDARLSSSAALKHISVIKHESERWAAADRTWTLNMDTEQRLYLRDPDDEQRADLCRGEVFVQETRRVWQANVSFRHSSMHTVIRQLTFR